MDKDLFIRQLASRFPHRLIEALEAVPRESFVPQSMRESAYIDEPLPIGHGQTISQPTTVLIMLDALNPQPGDRVLEIGTGSGWNAALLSHLVSPGGEVWTTELIPALAQCARSVIDRLGFDNVHVLHADGSVGLPAHAPFDKIIVTATAPSQPDVLLGQLAVHGCLIAPIASSSYVQDMMVYRHDNGQFSRTSLGEFVFVPMRGKFGFP